MRLKTVILKVTPLALLHASSAVFAQEQVITPEPVEQYAWPNQEVTIEVRYAPANPVDDTLTGLGLRIHWDSSKLSWIGLDGIFPTALMGRGKPEADNANFDGDSKTDRFVNLLWADFAGAWPGAGLTPVTLYSARFTTAANFTDATRVNFSTSGTAAGRRLVATSAVIDSGVASSVSRN